MNGFFESFVKFLRNTQPELSEEYVSRGYVTAVIWGVVMAALVIFATVATKTKLGKGIVTAIFQIIGSVGAHLCVIGYSKMVMMAEIKAPADQLDQAIADFYAEQIPLMGLYFLGFALCLAGVILMLIFSVSMMKKAPKICGVFALILSILRLAVIQPVNSFHMLEKATEASQLAWDGFYYTVAVLSAVLVGVTGLVHLLKKPAKQPVAESDAAEENVEEESSKNA